MTVIDLFSGVGGLSQGFVLEGFDIRYAVESDKSIAEAYKLNHPTTEVISEDICKVNLKELNSEDVTVIIGGPPCQGFSQKGKRLSINDERNFLFREFIRFVDFFKPKYFLMENVPNITTTSSGLFREEIIKEFSKLGYSIDCQVLNAVYFGIPQERKRAFFLGKRGNSLLELPLENKLLKKTTIKDAIYDLPFIESGKGEEISEYDKEMSSDYQKLMRKNSKKLFNHKATNHSKLALERLSMIPKGKGKEVLPSHHKTKSIFSGTWTRLKEDGQAATITTRFDTPSSGLFTHPILNRCLTVREAARIQSFSDDFIFYGAKTSQMKQVGNAVPPLLSKEIAKLIKKDILNESVSK